MAGTPNPATGTFDPVMPTVYADWGLRTGVTALLPNDAEVKLFKEGTDALLDSLASPHRIVMESTVHSFVPEDREAFIKRCAVAGHQLLFLPPRLTGRWSRELGMAKSDYSDPLVFKAMVEAGVHLRQAKLVDDAWVQKRVAANYELMILRYSGQKDEFADELIKLLPDYKSLDDVKKKALGNGKQYSRVGVAAAGMAAKYAENRAEFERLCGLYAHGYPSQIRADLHHWLYSGGSKRAKLDGEPLSIDKKGVKTYGIRKRKDITLSEFRRSLRWLYAQLRDAGSRMPVTGSVVPES
jgi:hypothetical protein